MGESLDFILISVPVLAEFIGMLLLYVVVRKKVRFPVVKKGMLVGIVISLLLATLPFLMMPIPTNLLFPLSLVLLLIYFKKEPSDYLWSAMLVVHLCYWLFGLHLLSSDGNTWGNSSAFLGLVSVINSILFINYFLLRLKSKKGMSLVVLVAASVGIILLYQWTKGFTLGEYSGDQEKWMRVMALLLCILTIIKGAFLLKRSSASVL